MKRPFFKLQLFILLFLILSSVQVNGQVKTKIKQSLKDKPNAILFAPINLFDFVNPNLQLGYERVLTNKFAIQVEGAWIINHSVENFLIDQAMGIKDCDYTNEGFKLRGEIKYFFYEGKDFFLYLAPEIFYLKNRSGSVSTFRVSDPNFQYSVPRPAYANGYDEFFYNDKEKLGYNLKLGLKTFIGKQFLLEPHLGIGVAYRKSTHIGRENPNDPAYDDFWNSDAKAGNMWVLSVPANIKVGYRF